ncbi:MAG: phage tail protein I [Sphingomonadales bacterium]|jgi:phage tail P2-like protein
MSLLPPNATPQERGLEAATARLGDVPVPVGSLWDPARCPAALLPWLAWALSIDSWSADWPESVKRARIAAAIGIQRRKGTLAGIRAAVAVFGGAVAITEWWQKSPPGIPHTFDVTLSTNASADLVEAAIAEIARAKPARSHFDFLLGVTGSAREGVISVARPAVYARLIATAPAVA